MTLTLQDLATLLGAEFHGDGAVQIQGVSSLDRQEPGTVIMVESQDQADTLKDAAVSAVLHPPEVRIDRPGIAHSAPRVLWAACLEHFHPVQRPPAGIHPTASVDQRAQVAESAYVGPHCVVGPHAQIGEHAVLMGFVVIGEETVVGAHALLSPHVVLGAQCRIGSDCQLEPWAKLGDGVTLGDSVDLGAHASVGNGANIESGAKVDNLVLIGPRSRIGAGSLLVGQSAVEREAVLYPGVVVAGQGSVAAGAVLHSGVQIGGRSLAEGELKEPGPYIGVPAIPLREEMKRRALERKSQRRTPGDTPRV